MSQLGAIGSYVLTELPFSRDWLRFINGTVNTLDDFKINTFASLKLGRFGKLVRDFDGFYCLQKTIENMDLVVLAMRKKDKDPWDLLKKTVKCAGAIFGALKWFGAIGGMMMLKPYARNFGYFKNACGLYSSVVNLTRTVKKVKGVRWDDLTCENLKNKLKM